MATTNIILAGFGGQGILFAGKVLAYAGLTEEKQVSWLPSYGPEMRGGTANCSVCISDDPIGSPLVLAPDILIAMNTPSCDKFIGAVTKGGVAVLDDTLVGSHPERDDIEIIRVPSTQLANDHDLQGLANIILLGRMLSARKVVSLESVQKAIDKSVPPRKANLIEANKRALSLGMSQL